VRAHQRPAEHASAQAPPGKGHVADAGRDLADRLVELRATGGKRPLWFLPPAAGTTLCYQRLAPLLDPDRPFYGIESYGLHSGVPMRRMEDVAADILGVIRQVQPYGPYLLGGWSFGAMVSHEVASQLASVGERIDLLIGVDGFQPNTGGWPVWTRPSLLAGGRWLQIQASLSLGLAPRVRYRVDGDAASIARIADVARVAGTAGMPRYVPVHNANIDAMLRYRPRPVSCDMLVLKTGADATRCARLGAKLAPLYRRVTVRPLPGNHWTVLDSPALGTVAKEIQAALRAVEEVSPDDEPRRSEDTPW
jgi:thioesterase domain-containing protein